MDISRSSRSNCCNIVGPSKELPLTDLPTNRDVLAYLNFLKERSVNKCDNSLLALDVAERVTYVYHRVGTNLPLIAGHSIVNKLRRLFKSYENAQNKSKRVKGAKKYFRL